MGAESESHFYLIVSCEMRPFKTAIKDIFDSFVQR